MQNRQKKKTGFKKILGKKRILTLLLGIALLSLLGNQWVLAAPSDSSIVLQSGTKLSPSQLVDKELERIYNSSESVQLSPGTLGGGTIEPWKEAKILMRANRDSKLDLEIKALNYSLYLQGIGDGTPENEVFTNHFDGYCASSSTNESSGQTFTCQSDPTLQYGDINAGSLVSGFRYEPERETAAKLFINNLVNPFPSGATSNPLIFSKEKLVDPNNRKLIAQALADQAVLSTSRNALSSVFARRRPIEELGGKSFMEIMEKEAVKDFLNDAWQQQMKKNYEAAMKAGKQELAMRYDQAIRDAYRNFLLYQMYREMEQNNVLMASMLTILQQQGKAAASVVSSASSQGGAAATAAGTGSTAPAAQGFAR